MPPDSRILSIDAPGPAKTVQQRTVYGHLNYLHQASQNILAFPTAGPALSQTLSQSMKSIASKQTIRFDPSVKHGHCQHCKVALVPGISCTVRNRQSNSHRHGLVTRCRVCGYSRNTPAPETPASSPKTRRKVKRKLHRKQKRQKNKSVAK